LHVYECQWRAGRLKRGASPRRWVRPTELEAYPMGKTDRQIAQALLRPRLAVVAGAFAWDDIGSWDALRRVRRPDPRGNVVIGNVTLGDDVADCVIWAEGEHFAVTGVRDMVVVRANGHTLVMPTGQPERLKLLVQRL